MIKKRRPVNIKVLSDLVRDLAIEGKKPVLIVDDACRLKDRVLKEVLVTSERCGLGLVLFSTKLLKKRQSFKAFARRIYICELDQMTDQDLRSYLRRRHDEDLQFSEVQLDNILSQSGGIPLKIDRLVDDLMDSPRRRLGVPLMHMSVIVVLIFVLIAGWNYENQARESDQVEPLTIRAHEGFNAIRLGAESFEHEVNVQETIATETAQELESGKVTRMVTTPKINLPTIETPDSKVAGPSTKLTTKNVTKDLVVTKNETTEKTGPSVTSGVEADSANTTSANIFSENISSENTPSPNPAPANPASAHPKKPLFVSQSELRPLEQTTGNMGKRNRQRNWILEAKGTDYTLQLMGSYSEAAILQLIESQGNDDAFAYFETKHRNQPWYVLTVGQYKDRESALLAISSLPPNLQSQKPWARSVASIRAAL